MNASRSGNTAPLRRIRCTRTATHAAGITTLGFLILTIFIGLFLVGTIRLSPVYLNYIKVAGVLDGVYDEFDSKDATLGAIKKSITRRFEVESVSVVTNRDIKLTPEDGGYLVEAEYDHTTPFLGNLYFTVKFDKSVKIRR